MMGTLESVFRFGDVEVREREFRLIKAGEVIPVEPKAFRVLLFLLHNPQKLITKEELLNAVWGETAVSENSLTRSIALLRRMLADDTHVPRYIETVATVGYRFVCPVEVSKDAHGDLASVDLAKIDSGIASETVPAGTQRRASWIHPRRWLTAVVVVAVGLAALAIWYLRRPLPPLRVTYNQITHDGRPKYPVGTDGARLYFVRWLEPQRVAQVAVTGGDASPVAVPLPSPTPLSVSPDGSTLLVASLSAEQSSLWSFRVLGGSLRHLADGGIVSATWSPDGKSIIYSTLNGEIDVMRNDGSESHRLTAGEVHAPLVGNFSWSPDGSKIRFTRGSSLFEMSPDGSGVHPFLADWHQSWQCCGSLSPDGRFFSFLMENQIWVLDERGGLLRRAPVKPVQLTAGPIVWWGPAVYFGKDSKTMFARGLILRGELDRFDIHFHQFQPFLGGISAEFLAFSPDDKSLAYVSYPEGILFKANRDGSNPVQLTDPPLHPTLLRWSPDGAQILFCAGDAVGHLKSYVIPSGGGTPRPILSEDKEPQSDPNWSPDGRKIVFSSAGVAAAGPGLDSVEKILDLSSHQISTIPGSEGSRSPRWSPNGRFISVLFGDDGLKIFDLNTQRWSVLRKMETAFPTWSRDSQFIYFVTREHDPGVYRIRNSGGDVERLVDLRGFRHTGTYTLWFALDPTDTPMLLRDVGTCDIYALTLEEK